jgi:predicted RND superfamily exporter protein
MPECLGRVDPAAFAAGAGALISAALIAASLRPDWVVRWPRVVLGLLLVVTLGASAILVRPRPLGLRLTIDPSTEPLLPAGDPGTGVYRKAVLDFGDDQIFVVAMECEDVFRSENLVALRRVSDAISRIEGVRGVKSLVKVTSFRYVPEQDWIEVGPFIEEIPKQVQALSELRRRALANPMYRQILVSEDGRTAAINVSFRKMTDREFIAADIDGRIRAILDAESEDGRRFHVSGRPHVKSRMYHIMTRDLALLIPLALVVVSVVLGSIAGTVRGLALPLATVSLAVVWTFGAIALLERPLTVLTVLLAPTLVAVGSVYGVHVVNRYEEVAALGGERRALALRCVRQMILPVLIAGLTTMVGYAALLDTDVPAVFETGAFSVLGIASVTLISLTGVPAALALLPVRAGGRRERSWLAERLGALLERGLAALARFAQRRPRPVILAWSAITLVALAAVPSIVIDTDYLSFFDAHAEVRREFDAINRLLAGAVPLYVVLEGGTPGALREPAVLRRIEALQARIDALPGVSRTLSFLDGLRVLNRAIEADDPGEERLPDTRGGVTELLFMFPKGDLARFSTVNQSAANLIVRTGEVGSAAMRALTQRIEATLDGGTLPEGIRAAVTGNAILLNRAADGVARSQPRTVGVAAFAIFGLLSVGLRSPRLGLVAMIPNVVPVVIFFGILGLGVAPLSLPTSLIGSVALGIAIDATAHYLVRYRAERRAGCSPEQAVQRTGVRVGRPIAIAAAMLVLGFLSVCFSEFATLRQFGFLSALTMTVCLLTDLLLLPALLVRWKL